MPPRSSPLLRVEGLEVLFGSASHPILAVDGVDFELQAGESVALVGESGCGKTLTALALACLAQEQGARCGGRIEWCGVPVFDMPETSLRRLRGAGIAYVFQDPLSALNPVRRVGAQVAEAVRLHERNAPVRRRVRDLLARVGLPDPDRQMRAYPHELSGGMRQRVVLAMALACRPRLLVADEPTTALDPTVQVQILALIDDLRNAFDMALLLVTHDLGLAWEHAGRALVMYAGRIVESGPSESVWGAPAHPYTRALLESLPGITPGARLPGIPGSVPRPDRWPPGCRFHPRCPYADPRCRTEPPVERRVDGLRRVHCHYPLKRHVERIKPKGETNDANTAG